MTVEEIQQMVWDELPFVRKNFVGRDRVDDLVLVAIEQAPIEFLGHVGPWSRERDVVARAWGQSVKRGYCLLYGEDSEMSPIFWLLIGPILNSLIASLLEWWWESSRNRVLLAGWKRRMCSD